MKIFLIWLDLLGYIWKKVDWKLGFMLKIYGYMDL